MERREKYLHMERREDWNLQAPEPQQAVRSLQAPPMHSCWARTEESSHFFFALQNVILLSSKLSSRVKQVFPLYLCPVLAEPEQC